MLKYQGVLIVVENMAVSRLFMKDGWVRRPNLSTPSASSRGASG